MAGRLIVLKAGKLEGDCEISDYKNWLRLDHLQAGASASIVHEDQTGSVHQGSIGVTVPFGPWVAEIQSYLFSGTHFDEIVIDEIEQQLDKQNKLEWRKVRELKLKRAWFESMSHAWNGIQANVEVRIEFDQLVFQWGDKVAEFKRDMQ
jgi:hypothetical protein